MLEIDLIRAPESEDDGGAHSPFRECAGEHIERRAAYAAAYEQRTARVRAEPVAERGERGDLSPRLPLRHLAGAFPHLFDDEGELVSAAVGYAYRAAEVTSVHRKFDELSGAHGFRARESQPEHLVVQAAPGDERQGLLFHISRWWTP